MFLYLQFLGQAVSYRFDFKLLINQNEHFVLSVTLEHRDILHFIVFFDVVLVEFETWGQKSFPSQRQDLFDRVEFFVVSFSILDPL